MHGIELYLIGGSTLLILSVIASKASGRIGVPSLLMFLAIGMLAGSEGVGKIAFDSPQAVQSLGVIALIYILFSGGLETDMRNIRPILREGILTGTIGVLITCVLTGLAARYILHFNTLESLLVGAIVSSTDAAAVFSVLHGKSGGLKGRIKPLLELESGANDPMAVLLTTGILQIMTGSITSPAALLSEFFKEMLIGALFGYAAGKVMSQILNRLKLEIEGLYPVLTLAMILFIYGLTQKLNGSGFLAVYIAGVVLGNDNFVHKRSLILFHDGVSWLMQIAMFLTLGLQVFPSRIVPVAGKALLISGFLIFIARPLAIFVSLIKSSFNFREKVMISWVGLRGSVPIILATYPLLAGIDKADTIFNLVFFIVLTSVMIQGTSIPFVAKLLKVNAPFKSRFRYPIEYVPTGTIKSDMIEIELPEDSPAIGKSILELGLPKDSLVVLLQRQGNVIVPKGSTHLEKNDTMLVLAETAALSIVKKLLIGNTEKPS